MKTPLIKMKKKVLILFLGVLSYSSCTEDSVAPLKDKVVAKSTGDGLYDLLGFGFDPIKGYLDVGAYRELKVLDVERLVTELPGLYYYAQPNSVVSEVNAGGNALEYSLELKNKFEASITVVSALTASISNDVTASKKVSTKYSYATFYQRKVLKVMQLKHSIETLKNYLTADFISSLNTYSPQDIIRLYGTHVLTDISVGGRMDANFRSYTNQTNKKLTVTAGVKVAMDKIFSIGGSTSADVAIDQYNEQTRLTCQTFGGSSAPDLNLTFDVKNPPIVKPNLTAWVNSVTNDNAVMVDIGNGSLIPIYKLVSDPAKSEALRVATVAYLNVNQYALIDGSIKCGFGLSNYYDKAISLDYNGDGVQDLLFYRPGGGIVYVNEGLINGTFTNAAAYSNGLATYDFNSINDKVLALDFNSDGKDDLMCYRPGSGYVYLLQSNGDATFTKVYSGSGIGTYDFSSTNDQAITLDFNGDNRTDIMCYRPGKKVVYILQGNGNGGFTKVYSSTSGIAGYDFSTYTDRATAFDYDNDGKDDLLTYRPGNKIVWIARSNGNGTYTNVYKSSNGIGGYDFNDTRDKALALDYNGDGRDDLMCYRPGVGYVYILRSNGNTTFSNIYQGSGIATYDLKHSNDQIIALDYNNDNLSDIILYRPGVGYAYAASSQYVIPSGTEIYQRDYPY